MSPIEQFQTLVNSTQPVKNSNSQNSQSTSSSLLMQKEAPKQLTFLNITSLTKITRPTFTLSSATAPVTYVSSNFSESTPVSLQQPIIRRQSSKLVIKKALDSLTSYEKDSETSSNDTNFSSPELEILIQK